MRAISPCLARTTHTYFVNIMIRLPRACTARPERFQNVINHPQVTQPRSESKRVLLRCGFSHSLYLLRCERASQRKLLNVCRVIIGHFLNVYTVSMSICACKIICKENRSATIITVAQQRNNSVLRSICM